MNINNDNQVTIIEIPADYLCLVILGDKVTIDNLVDELEKTNNTQTVKYISIKISEPIANKCHELTKFLNKGIDIEISNETKIVLLDDGVESAQCYTYAEGYNNQLHMLMIMSEEENSYILGFPKFELGEEEDPEILIEKWFKKKINKLPSGIKRNMKIITVVGSSSNILVIATKIKNKIKNL